MTTPVLSIDTREAFRTLTVKLDGTVYTMRPLGSKDTLTILDNAETIDKLSAGVANRETLETAKNIIFPLVESLMSPADKFSEWKAQTRERSDLAYQRAMSALCGLMAKNITVDIKGE
jgi:hypothetical protein